MTEQTGGSPIEVQKVVLQEKLGKEYPAVYFDQLKLIDTQTTRLAIDDVSYRTRRSLQDEIEILALSSKGWLEVYDARDVTMALAQKLRGFYQALNPERTLILLPGNGSQIIWDLLSEDMLSDFLSRNGQFAKVPTQRRINLQTGAVERVDIAGNLALRKMFTDRKVEMVLVLDDVITTGATINALWNALPLRKAQWYAGAPMMLSPLQNRNRSKTSRSGVEGYDGIIAPVIYQGTTGIPPLNSLSTLVGNSQKSEIIRSRYMDKNVEDQSSFLMAVKQIRQAMC